MEEVLELTRDDIIEALETGARRRRAIGGAEMIAAYRAGRLEDPGEVGDLLVLADLLDPNDPFFTPA